MIAKKGAAIGPAEGRIVHIASCAPYSPHSSSNRSCTCWTDGEEQERGGGKRGARGGQERARTTATTTTTATTVKVNGDGGGGNSGGGNDGDSSGDDDQDGAPCRSVVYAVRISACVGARARLVGSGSRCCIQDEVRLETFVDSSGGKGESLHVSKRPAGRAPRPSRVSMRDPEQ